MVLCHEKGTAFVLQSTRPLSSMNDHEKGDPYISSSRHENVTSNITNNKQDKQERHTHRNIHVS